MKIIQLQKNHKKYNCNSYLILGNWNRMSDINTLVDPGQDGSVIDEIEQLSTGFGKVRVEQVLLTHNHFDHAGGMFAIKDKYGAKVMAFADMPGVDVKLKNGQVLKAGDSYFDVIHTPGHSSDSICLYCAADKVLFSGDTLLRIRATEDIYTPEYIDALAALERLDIRTIYSGHDAPVFEGAGEMIRNSLRFVHRA